MKYSLDGQVLQKGTSIICIDLDGHNRMVLCKDIWVSAFGNILEDPQDHAVYKSVHQLCIEASFINPFTCKEKNLIQVPLLFESHKEAEGLVQIFAERNLPVTGECISRKSFDVFIKEIQKAIQEQKRPPQ